MRLANASGRRRAHVVEQALEVEETRMSMEGLMVLAQVAAAVVVPVVMKSVSTESFLLDATTKEGHGQAQRSLR